MAVVYRYVLVDTDDVEDNAEYESREEAIREAKRLGDRAVLRVEYEYADSTLDWTPDGGDSWPPRR